MEQYAFKTTAKSEFTHELACSTVHNHYIYVIIQFQIIKEKNIGFEALTVSHMLNGDYILIAGCNKQCHLLSADGIKLLTIGDVQDSWIWCCKANPTSPFIVSSTGKLLALLPILQKKKK